jgi:hypothetical protein
MRTEHRAAAAANRSLMRPARDSARRAPWQHVLLALAWLFTAAPAHAWGPAGHRIVARLAERELAPATRTALAPLLAAAHANSLPDVATWADELRDERGQRRLWHATSALHFVNFAAPDCRYVAPRDCRDGRCVVAAIERYARVLGDRSQSRDERAEALRFVVHFVADVHQPLHAGYRSDRGGNRHQVRLDGRGTNLHAVWDTPVLASRGLGWRAYADELARAPLPHAGGTPAQWAEESCRATRDDAIYPPGHAVDDGYLARMRPLAERRVRLAAARLAALLEHAFATRGRR